MSFTSMIVRPNYDEVVTNVVGAVQSEEHNPEEDAKIALLNHLLLQRYGMDMTGRLGINSTRGKLAQLFLKEAKGKNEAEKAKEAVKKVDAIILAFNQTLDKLHLPNKTTGKGK